MAQKSNIRRINDNQAQAILRNYHYSPQKMGLIANAIRGKAAQDALDILSMMRRRASQDIRKLLMSAIANAENNHNLDIDQLYVSEIFVGKDMMLRRFRPRARGRAARIKKTYSNMTLIVSEKKESA